MDPNMLRFLLLLFVINLAFRLLRRLREPAVDPLYNALLVADVVLCGYGLSSPERAHSLWALLGVVIFGGAVLIPAILSIFVQLAMNRSRWEWALRLAGIRQLLAPIRDFQLQIEHIRRLQKAHTGDVASLERDLAAEIARAQDPQERRLLKETLVELLAFSGQWERCLEMFARIQEEYPDLEITRPTLAVALIRASLETRNPQAAWRFYKELRRFDPADPTVVSAFLSAEIMFLAAYGHSEVLEQALYPVHRPHPVIPVSSKRYWLGVAHLQEGNKEKAAKYLDFPERLVRDNPVLGRLARQRLEAGPQPLEAPSAAQEAELRAMAQRTPRLFLQIRGPKPPVATGVFLAGMVAAFLAQIFLGGPDNVWALFRMGANFRHLALEEPARLVIAMFLHAGYLHIALNGLMLFLFGRMLEAHFGFLRTMAVFVFSGIAGNLASALVYRQGVSVGASSSVFGMLGATLMLFVVARDMWHPVWRKKQVYNLVFLLLLNLVVGISMPMIDNAAHVGGFMAGSLLGWFFLVFGAKTPVRRHVVRAIGIAALTLVGWAALQAGRFDADGRMRVVSWEQEGHRVSMRAPLLWELQNQTLQNVACRLMPTVSVFFVPQGDAVDMTILVDGFLSAYKARQKGHKIEEIARRQVDGFLRVVDFRFHFEGRAGKETMFFKSMRPGNGIWVLRFVHDASCASSVEPFMERVARSFSAETTR